VGKRRVAMAQLRSVFEDLGHRGVWTFLNSGNVIFTATGRRASLVGPIERALQEAFGFEVRTLLRTGAEVGRLAARQPFATDLPGGTHMVVLLRDPLSPEQAKAVESLSTPRERLVADGTEVHWHIDGTLMDSRLTDRNWKVLGDQPSTNRNHTMLVKLAAKLED
jgi:uncharacterized protein (DUF1697 family)